MSTVITSPGVIRRLLGKHLLKIKAFDPLPRERRLTRRLRKKLIKRYGEQCGYCLRRCDVETAHVRPLEIGERTVEENLILLCKTCHGSYDGGQLSISSMEQIARDWRRKRFPNKARSPMAKISPPKQTITPAPPSLRNMFEIVSGMIRKRKYLKASKLIKERLLKSDTKLEDRLYLLIKLAELTRRRSARGTVEQALRILRGINVDSLPAKYLPAFAYELSYVHRLLGNHAEAGRILRNSIKADPKRRTAKLRGLAFVAAVSNEIHCEMAAIEKPSRRQAAKLERQFEKLHHIAKKDGGFWGGRWEFNCVADILRVRIKAGDSGGSWKAYKRLCDVYFASDTTNGWAAPGRQWMSQLAGLVYALFARTDEELDRGIGLLARSLTSYLSLRQRPEGIRDAGFGLVKALRKKFGRNPTSDLLERLMHRTVDGTSVLWPWNGAVSS